MKLETKRLILRRPRLSDWKDLVEGIGDLKVSCMLDSVPHPYRKKDAIEWIKKSISKWRKKDQKDYIFFIELKSEKKVIGDTGLFKVDKFRGTCETGSWINKKYWKKGYILEAKVPVLDFVFDKLKLRKIETGAYVKNKASQGMSKRLGFKLEGKKRKSHVSKATGKIHDAYIYGLFKEDWKKNLPRLKKRLNNKIKRLK